MIHKSRDIFLSIEDIRNIPGKLRAVVGPRDIIESDILDRWIQSWEFPFASYPLSLNDPILYFHGGRVDTASTSQDDSISFQRG